MADDAELKGYLPPQGPAHGVPYRWLDAQRAHRIGNSVVEDSAEDIILTVSDTAQRACERSGLEEVPEDVTEDALDAVRDGDYETANEVVAEWQSDEGDVADPEDERPAIPDDEGLDDLAYRGDDGDDASDSLQNLAEAYGIKANQSADELRDQLADARDAEET